MFIRQYINSGVTYVLAIVFLSFAIFSFGYAEYFDRLFIIYLIAVAILNSKNVNILTIVGILMFERLLEELIFFSNTLGIAKFATYALSMLFLRFFWYDSIVKRLVLPVIVISSVAEIYWYTIGYESPRIHFYVGMIWLNVLTRHLLFIRTPSCRQLTLKGVAQTSLDLQLYSLSKWNVIFITIMIAEYIVRHLSYVTSLIIYHSYPYAMHFLSVFALFYITNHIFNSSFKMNA